MNAQLSNNFLDFKVGIIGAGIAGLYSALLLQSKGYTVNILEASDRVGGRVRTHHFTKDENQYFEAGAMRIPVTKFQDTIFSLIRYVNSHEKLPRSMAIRLIDFVYHHEGNYSYFGSTVLRHPVSDVTPASAGWTDVPEPYQNRSAGDLLTSVLEELTQGLDNSFDETIERIVETYDQSTFRGYLIERKNWPPTLISFVETTLFHPNAFSYSIIDICMKYLDFNSKKWKTIDQGMSRLTDAMAYLIGHENITLGANVTALINTGDHRVTVKATCSHGSFSSEFDRVILALPAPALSSITTRPRWSIRKEMAIRSLNLEPAYKLGLRFETRFWERLSSGGSMGGQCVTDLPIRALMYPSYGIGTSGPGVLQVYLWLTDAQSVIPLTTEQRQRLALDGIAELYQDQLGEDGERIDVHGQFIEASETMWSEPTATGLTLPRPGQFSTHLKWAKKAENNIFFAGSHLTYHYDWMLGAALSSIEVVKDMLQEDVQPLTDVSTEFKPRL
ncbi:l-amino-acid oxidase [Fusarium sporotrichioides]|uniref:L-amino-acid oxidase n=1 Tax=Fusarium sporotrichioides TaxID=5514 RepID=A0A395RXT5_FUSSP|nr:l-amino-acid oxidase [Fusarium sporotrichioides]